MSEQAEEKRQDDQSRQPNWIRHLKKVKHIEIIAALALAFVAILIYFGVSAAAKGNGQGTVHTTSNDDLSGQIAQVLSQMQGVGSCSVAITYDTPTNSAQSGKNVLGVVVVAEGGSDMRVKLTIIDAICALLEVDGSNVKVYPMK